MASSAFEVMIKELQSVIDNYQESLVKADAKDYAEYRGMCGVIRGLTYAQEIINSMQNKYLNGEEND
ncbi:MAG: hypothetical protein RLZZ602_1620 [Pseudomonadota bacterium]|jgi:hypothetical protein